MNATVIADTRFNALTDPWLPLLDASGTATMASPVEVLCGEKDGIDLDYPRDDFRVYARLLLSAIVQALFCAGSKAELEDRLDRPLSRAEVEARVQPVASHFDLFGPTPFLQDLPPEKEATGGAAAFVFTRADLYQPEVDVDAISLPIALVTLFAEQTYAGGAGRGYGAGPGGQPGAFTLIDPGSIRAGAWANTLSLERVHGIYPPDGERPWSNAKCGPQPRAAIGLVAGLFFQPRAIWLVPAGTGRCSLTGRQPTRLVRLSPFLAKSTLAKKAAKQEDVWQHPCAPLAMNSQGIGAIRLNVERPAWTGLAQLLDPIAGARTKVRHPLQGPAPVVQQWRALRRRDRRPRLLVLDFDRDKANVRRRFFESFPISADLLTKPDAVERLRELAAAAEKIEVAMVRELTRAHDDRKLGGLAVTDARTSYWVTTEGSFYRWLDVVTGDESDGAWVRAQAEHDRMLKALRRRALAIFDEHVALSEFDPRKQERIAKARRSLTRALWADARASLTPATETVETPT